MSKGLDKVIKIIDATAFEQGKKYLIKVTPKDLLPKEEFNKLLVLLKEVFDSKGIDAIFYPSDVCEIEAAEIKRENDSRI